MSDIFISYSKADRAKAATLAKALEHEGWSVWWDPKTPPGKTFDEVIEQALERAKCIIVMWSKKSVTSRWVKAEAAEGNRRAVLVPALLEDDAKIPLEFRYQHASRLTDWQGQSGHLEFEELKNAVAQLVGSATTVAESSSNLSRGGVPVAAKIERPPLTERVSQQVQADRKRTQSQAKQTVWEIRFGSKILPARVVLLVLAGIVAVVVRYAWTNWAHTNGGEGTLDGGLPGETSKAEPEDPNERPKNQPAESKPELSKNKGAASQGETTKAEPDEPKARLKNRQGEQPLVDKNLVYLDPTTVLSWTKSDNGRSVTWPQAQQYCENLSLGSYSDWRLPTIEQLEKLYDPKVHGRYKIRKPFELTACCPWSATQTGSGSAWGFNFGFGGGARFLLGGSDLEPALCVRGPGE